MSKGLNINEEVLGTRIHVSPGQRVENRIREIAAENDITLTAVIKEAIRCYVILYDGKAGI